MAGPAEGSGDVGVAVEAVPADRGIPQDCDDGGSGPVSRLMRVFTERHVSYVVQPIFDVPVLADPGLQIVGCGLAGGQ